MRPEMRLERQTDRHAGMHTITWVRLFLLYIELREQSVVFSIRERDHGKLAVTISSKMK